jgi:hypothetical protein
MTRWRRCTHMSGTAGRYGRNPQPCILAVGSMSIAELASAPRGCSRPTAGVSLNQRRGFRVELRRGAVNADRRHKPSIPMLGDHRIPLADEFGSRARPESKAARPILGGSDVAAAGQAFSPHQNPFDPLRVERVSRDSSLRSCTAAQPASPHSEPALEHGE